MLEEIARLLADDGVLEFIDEDLIMPRSSAYSSTLPSPVHLEQDFLDMLATTHLNELCSGRNIDTLLRAHFSTVVETEPFVLALPPIGIDTSPASMSIRGPSWIHRDKARTRKTTLTLLSHEADLDAISVCSIYFTL